MSLESSIYISRDNFFKNQIKGPLPKPPTFKHGFNGQPFTIPCYYPFEHSETQWIINMLRSNSWIRLEKLALLNPKYLDESYFQLPDNPTVENGRPMFHSRAILYLNVLGLTLYFQATSILKNLLNFRLSDGSRLLCLQNSCYATNLFIKHGDQINDLLQFHPNCIIILREAFDSIEPMIKMGCWFPLKKFCFLYRRPFKICKFVYRDIIEYSLSQLVTKTSLRLPHIFNCLINCFNESFSLLYYEQIKIQYGNSDVEEWVSIPRRLLRFGFYYDKDMRLMSQIVRSISIFQLHSFFFGPTKTCFEINYESRLTCLISNFEKDCCDPELSRVILDQDNCIALLLGMLEHAHTYRHNVAKDKILSLLPQILFDTKWLLHFIIKKPVELINYFGNLLEKVGYVPELIIKMVKFEVLKYLTSDIIPICSIKELRIRPNEVVCVEDVLKAFAKEYRHGLGGFVDECKQEYIDCTNCDEEDKMNNHLIPKKDVLKAFAKEYRHGLGGFVDVCKQEYIDCTNCDEEDKMNNHLIPKKEFVNGYFEDKVKNDVLYLLQDECYSS